mgnify:FL=1
MSPSRTKANAMIKKKFSSAEKVRKTPFHELSAHQKCSNNTTLSRDSELSSSDSSQQALRLTIFNHSNESPKMQMMLVNNHHYANKSSIVINNKKLDFAPRSTSYGCDFKDQARVQQPTT